VTKKHEVEFADDELLEQKLNGVVTEQQALRQLHDLYRERMQLRKLLDHCDSRIVDFRQLLARYVERRGKVYSLLRFNDDQWIRLGVKVGDPINLAPHAAQERLV
jgi:hypothetical protein